MPTPAARSPGDSEAFARLASGGVEIARLRDSLGASEGPAAELVNGGNWQSLEAEIAKLGAAREMLLELHAARERLLELAPQLLAATANLASALPPADLATAQPSLDRFELTVESIRQNVARARCGYRRQRIRAAFERRRAVPRSDHPRSARRGPKPRRDAVRGQAAQANLDSATRLFEQTRAAIRTIVAGDGQLNAAASSVAALDTAGTALLAAISARGSGGAGRHGAVLAAALGPRRHGAAARAADGARFLPCA